MLLLRALVWVSIQCLLDILHEDSLVIQKCVFNIKIFEIPDCTSFKNLKIHSTNNTDGELNVVKAEEYNTSSKCSLHDKRKLL